MNRQSKSSEVSLTHSDGLTTGRNVWHTDEYENSVSVGASDESSSNRLWRLVAPNAPMLSLRCAAAAVVDVKKNGRKQHASTHEQKQTSTPIVGERTDHNASDAVLKLRQPSDRDWPPLPPPSSTTTTTNTSPTPTAETENVESVARCAFRVARLARTEICTQHATPTSGAVTTHSANE